MRKRLSLRLTSVFGSCLLVGSAFVVSAVAAPLAASAAGGTFVCSGTSLPTAGVLSGTYNNVLVQGVCAVPAGPAVVNGTVTIAPGGVLVAAFHSGQLTVQQDVVVQPGGTAILGCFATSSPCLDDPKTPPTLNGPVTIQRDVLATGALGVLVHDGTIGRDVRASGGGGGVSCDPPFPGVFGAIGSPAFSDFEDSSVGRDLSVTGLASCWVGILRVNVGRDIAYSGNTLADPDASEVHNNVVGRDISCSANSPAVQYGDAHDGTPNLVGRNASGECGFGVLQPNGPDGTLTPISVKA
jgi:hypothetical protein